MLKLAAPPVRVARGPLAAAARGGYRAGSFVAVSASRPVRLGPRRNPDVPTRLMTPGLAASVFPAVSSVCAAVVSAVSVASSSSSPHPAATSDNATTTISAKRLRLRRFTMDPPGVGAAVAYLSRSRRPEATAYTDANGRESVAVLYPDAGRMSNPSTTPNPVPSGDTCPAPRVGARMPPLVPGGRWLTPGSRRHILRSSRRAPRPRVKPCGRGSTPSRRLTPRSSSPTAARR